MRKYLDLFYTPTPLRAGLAFILALASILGALGSQYLLGVEPCEICYWERWPYYLGVPVLAVVLSFWKMIPIVPRLGLSLVGALIFLVSTGLGVYHAGIEYRIWPGPASCTGLDAQISFSDLDGLSTLSGVVPCDVAPFQILGVSMAGFNALGSLVIAGLLFWSMLGQWQRFKGTAR